MKALIIALTGACAVSMAVCGCEMSCSFSSAGLSEAAVSAAVNPETQQPTQVKDAFASNAEKIFATAKVSYAPEGTKAKAVFYYLESGAHQINEAEVDVSGTRYVSFYLTPPVSGWPAGRYEVRYFLNGKEEARRNFTVEAAPSLPAAAPSAPQEQPTRIHEPAAQTQAELGEGYKTVRAESLGVSFQAPRDWTWELTKRQDYMLSGPSGADSFEIAVVLQAVSKSPGGSPREQIDKARQQFAQVPKASFVKEGTTQIAGVNAPFFIVRYQAADSAQRQVEFHHSQIVIEIKDFYLWLSYAAPTAIYRKYLPEFQRLVDTLTAPAN